MGQPDHLDVSDLSDADRAAVIDLVARLRERAADEGEAALRAALADPSKRDVLYASLREADASIDRGEGVDGEAFFRDLMVERPE